MPHAHALDDVPYRGLYAGVAEAAALAGVSRAYAQKDFRLMRDYPQPVAYLMPMQEKWPVWYLRDIVRWLESKDRLIMAPEELIGENARPIEPWEYTYGKGLVGTSQIAQIGGFSTGNVHQLHRTREGFPPYADGLRMGTVWREREVRDALRAMGYPRTVRDGRYAA